MPTPPPKKPALDSGAAELPGHLPPLSWTARLTRLAACLVGAFGLLVFLADGVALDSLVVLALALTLAASPLRLRHPGRGTVVVAGVLGWFLLAPVLRATFDFARGTARVHHQRGFGRGGLVDRATGLPERYLPWCGNDHSQRRYASPGYDATVRALVRILGRPAGAYQGPYPSPAEAAGILDAEGVRLVLDEDEVLRTFRGEGVTFEAELLRGRHRWVQPLRELQGELEAAVVEDRLLLLRTRGPDPRGRVDPTREGADEVTWIDFIDLDQQCLIGTDVL